MRREEAAVRHCPVLALAVVALELEGLGSDLGSDLGWVLGLVLESCHRQRMSRRSRDHWC